MDATPRPLSITRDIRFTQRLCAVLSSAWAIAPVAFALLIFLAATLLSRERYNETTTASGDSPQHRVVISKSLGEITANLSSPSEYIHTVVRLDIDQRALREVLRRDETLSREFTRASRGRLSSLWSARYSKRATDRLAIDTFVDRYTPRLRDAILRVLAVHSAADLRDDQWITKLRRELRAGLNLAINLPKPIIVNVGVSSFRVEQAERLTMLKGAPSEDKRFI